MESTGSNRSSHDVTGTRNQRDDDSYPLWQYVTKLEKTGGGGGNVKWVCNFCHHEKQGTYTRVRAHLLKITGKGIGVCHEVGHESIAEMRKLDELVSTRISNEQPKQVSLPTTSQNPLSLNESGADSSKRSRVDDSPLARIFDMQTRSQLDEEIARMFFSGGLPFNLARNPYYINSYSFAANHPLGDYRPPSYNKLRTTLLEREKARVEKLLDPIKSTWMEKGVSIVSDGWSDPQRSLINVMVVCESGPMFVKSVDCSREVKDGYFIANLLTDVINDVGHQKVVQIITDDAKNCKTAGEIIEGIFPHIYWTPCIVHTLNLALKNICAAKNVEINQETYEECHWITEIHGDAIQIKNFIMNHSMRLRIFNRFGALKLLSIADTRLASIIVMLKRFKHIRCALEAMVISDEWIEYQKDDQRKARFVSEKVMDDEWWEKVTYILDFAGPIYDMIRFCDTDKPCLHLVYEMWYSMIQKVKIVIYDHERKPLADFSSFYHVIHCILVDRWTKNNISLYCLAHSLNPRYYSDIWLQEGENRLTPHMDEEVSLQRNKCFRRIFSDDECIKAFEGYANFSLKSGLFADPDSINSMYAFEDPRKWWACYGSNAPLLQKLAFRVLGQPTSSSCCERNWSTYSFVHSLRRNKLTPKRAEDLIFIHNNLRLLSRRSSQYTNEKTRMWDVGGDDFMSMEDIGILEFANLSIDEPELESVFFNGVEE